MGEKISSKAASKPDSKERDSQCLETTSSSRKSRRSARTSIETLAVESEKNVKTLNSTQENKSKTEITEEATVSSVEIPPTADATLTAVVAITETVKLDDIESLETKVATEEVNNPCSVNSPNQSPDLANTIVGDVYIDADESNEEEPALATIESNEKDNDEANDSEGPSASVAIPELDTGI